MKFSKALKKLNEGYFLTREGWNNSNQFVFLQRGECYDKLTMGNCPFPISVIDYFVDEGINMDVVVKDCLCLKSAQDNIILGWAPSQTDLLADDWEIFEY